MNQHERSFLTFLVEPGRRRTETLLDLGPQGRTDFRALLDHPIAVDPRHAKHLQGADAFPTPIEALLKAHGAPAFCHVLSAREDLDDREMPLREALNAVVGRGHGAFISCIPGKLGLFEGEGPNSCWLLSTAPATPA